MQLRGYVTVLGALCLFARSFLVAECLEPQTNKALELFLSFEALAWLHNDVPKLILRFLYC